MGEAKRRKDKGMYWCMPECDDCRSAFEVEQMPDGRFLCGFCCQLLPERSMDNEPRKSFMVIGSGRTATMAIAMALIAGAGITPPEGTKGG